MLVRQRSGIVALLITSLFCVSSASALALRKENPTEAESTAVPPAESVRVPIVTMTAHHLKGLKEARPKGTRPKKIRLVIADINGLCAQEVKDALMRRLTDNPDYEVLSRDNLDHIMREQDKSWNASFNSKTAVTLGNLLGASRFIVGRVTYCDESPFRARDLDFWIHANLQILDLTTGTILLSTSSEGKFLPKDPSYFRPDKKAKRKLRNFFGSTPNLELIPPHDSQERLTSPESSALWYSDEMSPYEQPPRLTPVQFELTAGLPLFGGKGDKPKPKPIPDRERFPKIRAADDLANSFANKFFSRPTFDEVDMWKDPGRIHSLAVQWVRLGQCPKAAKFIETEASLEVPSMSEDELARYLHNYGVTLLCSGELKRAVLKLRSAYRLKAMEESLRMIDLASELDEWNLKVEVVTEPEMTRLAGED